MVDMSTTEKHWTEITEIIDPEWGEMYGPHPYVTPDGVVAWMWRKGKKVRFYDPDGNQVGPEHANITPAVVWAAAHAWYDHGASPSHNAAMWAEVRANSSYFVEKNPDAGAWTPVEAA